MTIQYFKTMCKLGKITIFNSLIPILTWVLLAFILNDKNLMSIFSLTYSVQFLPYLVIDFMVSGNIIGKERGTTTDNHIYSGIVISNIICIVIMIFVSLNIKTVALYLGMRSIRYKYWVLYSLWLMYFTLPLIQYLDLLYFEGKENEASKTSLIFNIIYCFGVIILYIICKNEVMAIVINISMLGLYVYSKLISKLHKFKFTFNIFKGVKYQLTVISSDLIMFLTYLFGMKRVFEYSQEFAFAVSFCGLITDTQWDMITNGISTVAKVEIAKGKYILKNIFKAAVLYGILIASSIWMLLAITYRVCHPNLNYVFIILCVETVDMLIVFPRYIKQVWIDIEINSKLLALLMAIIKVIRLIISVYIPTIYALWIAQIISGILNYIVVDFIYIRNKHYRVKE